jgi:pimeloyl-ACP methyl ester carboxylesterase
VVGISNFVSFLTNTESYRRDLRRAEYGDERDPKMRAFLESISPLNRADRIKKPLLVIQGANDPRVPAAKPSRSCARCAVTARACGTFSRWTKATVSRRNPTPISRSTHGCCFAEQCLN